MYDNPDFREEDNGIGDFRNATFNMTYDTLRHFRNSLTQLPKKSAGRWAILVNKKSITELFANGKL